MAQAVIEIIKNVCHRTGGIVVTDERLHQGTVPEVDRQKNLPAFPALDRIHFDDCDIRIGCKIFLEVFISAANVALLIDFYRFLLFPDAIV